MCTAKPYRGFESHPIRLKAAASFELKGVGEMTSYHTLDENSASEAAAAAFEYIRGVLQLRFQSEAEADKQLMFWTGYNAAE